MTSTKEIRDLYEVSIIYCRGSIHYVDTNSIRLFGSGPTAIPSTIARVYLEFTVSCTELHGKPLLFSSSIRLRGLKEYNERDVVLVSCPHCGGGLVLSLINSSVVFMAQDFIFELVHNTKRTDIWKEFLC